MAEGHRTAAQPLVGGTACRAPGAVILGAARPEHFLTERERGIRAALHQIGAKIEAYVWIKTAVSLLTGGLCYIALAVIGVDFAPFWALLIFILNFIPYIGATIGVLFPTLLAMLQCRQA